MIKIQNYDKGNQKLSFVVSDMEVGLANAIRRSALEIPVMAIDEIEVFKNDSALYDEIIAHRLGLVPIKTDKTIKKTKFKLKVVGPKVVYSTDLQPSVGTNYRLPIVILDEGQEIEIVANARLGKGVEHVKYSPGLIYYAHDLDSGILDFVNVDSGGKVNYPEEKSENKLPKDKENEIKKIKKINELVFNIESWGQIDAKGIFIKAIGALDENLQELDKAVK